MQMVPTQHWHVPVEEQVVAPRTHGLHAEGMQPPSLEPEELDPNPLEEAERAQAPALQIPPALVQSVHAAPPVPQAMSRVPARQVVVVSQHPAAHVTAVHGPPAPLLDEELVGGRQAPEVQVMDAPMQLAHREPPRPHAVSLIPGKQAPPASQQPAAHEVGSHAPVLASEVPDEPLDAELVAPDEDPLDVLESPDPLLDDVLEPAVPPPSPHMHGPSPLPSALQTW
jgi:hypothetical protein